MGGPRRSTSCVEGRLCQYEFTPGKHSKREEGDSRAHPLLHVGDDLLGLGDLLPRDVVILGRVQRCELDLLVLQLELGALDGRLELLGRLVA